MVDQKQRLFRKESLERLSSPERLDQLMQVVRPMDWLPLATLGVLVLLTVIWSIFGRIPITVSGRGILIPSQKVAQNVSGGKQREQQTTQVENLVVEDSSNPLVSLAYFTIGDGKRIQPGMRVMVTPDTVKREQFGGMLATVAAVSALPVTKQSAADLVGNADVAEALISESGQMQVIAKLKLDPSTFSGYEWSSKGSPRQKMSPGTTTSVSVILEEQAPIAFVFPILRSAGVPVQ